MTNKSKQLSFNVDQHKTDNGPVVCLGMTFKNDDERREYFRDELRKKLPELKQIEGFPIGEDEDIIALSDPPYYTACPNPWINDFIEEWEKEKVTKYGRDPNEEYHREPFAADVSEGKSDPIYNAHSYHTKVPPKAIMRYILHYTKPGDIVFDGFSGTGMTGVASSLCAYKDEIEELGYKVDDKGNVYEQVEYGDKKEWVKISELGARNSILNDLSPIATHISLNYNNGNNFNEFLQKTIDIVNDYEREYSWIYSTLKEEFSNYEAQFAQEIAQCNSIQELKNWFEKKEQYFQKINYIVWTDELVCPSCTEHVTSWEMTLNKSSKKNLECPNCGISLEKSKMENVKYSLFDQYLGKVVVKNKKIPVLINFKTGTKKPDSIDLKIIEKINQLLNSLNLFVPIKRMPVGSEARRNDKSGITHTHQFYTERNLFILALLWDKSKENRVLRLSLTSILFKTASLLHNIGIKKGKINLAGALPNSLYIPGNIAERNIFTLLKGKINDIANAKLNKRENQNILSCMSLGSDIPKVIEENQVDYIFIDPPFGSNLMYSELNFIWESWLNVFTNSKPEAIVNKSQNKDIDDYRELMVRAFKSCYYILKPGRWMTVEFSNTKAAVWNAIQSAIQEAGFIIVNVSALHKGQGTYNAQTNPTSVTQDLVISAVKPTNELLNLIHENSHHGNESTWHFVDNYLEILPRFIGKKGSSEPIIERTPRVLYDRLVSYFVQNGLPVPLSSSEFQEGIAQRYPMRDGMVFLESQVAEYDRKRIIAKEFTQMSLFVSDENSAIEWIRQQLMNKPQTRQDLHPEFMKQIQHIAKHEALPELDDLLEQNFLCFAGAEPVPNQILTYLRRNYKDLRGLEPTDPKVIEKAMHRWYVPDPNKQADLEKLREKSLLREFDDYLKELEGSKKKLRTFRTEAIRAGFKNAYKEKDFETIVKIGDRIPEKVIQEDDKLFMFYENAKIRLGL